MTAPSTDSEKSSDSPRCGMVVAGHTTESLPKVVLEVERDEIHATGILGLIYGKRQP